MAERLAALEDLAATRQQVIALGLALRQHPECTPDARRWIDARVAESQARIPALAIEIAQLRPLVDAERLALS